MRRYWMHLVIVLIAVGLVATACVVRTRPGYRQQHIKQKHAKHKKHHR